MSKSVCLGRAQAAAENCPDMSDPPVPRPLARSPVGRRAHKHRFWGERTAATTPHRLVLDIGTSISISWILMRILLGMSLMGL